MHPGRVGDGELKGNHAAEAQPKHEHLVEFEAINNGCAVSGVLSHGPHRGGRLRVACPSVVEGNEVEVLSQRAEQQLGGLKRGA